MTNPTPPSRRGQPRCAGTADSNPGLASGRSPRCRPTSRSPWAEPTRAQPVEQLLGSLGNCLAVGYAANASVAGIAIRDLRIELTGDVDLHTFLGLRDGHAGFDDIRVTVHLDADAPADQLQALHDKVVGSSPVGHTLARAVPVTIELDLTAGSS